MIKIVITFLIWTITTFGQFKVTINSERFINNSNGKKYSIVKIHFLNSATNKQILFLQNWRIAVQTYHYITGFPEEQRLINRIYLMDSTKEMHHNLLGVEAPLKWLNKNSFKAIEPNEEFQIALIVDDEFFQDYYDNGKLKLVYLYSYSDYKEFKLLSDTFSELQDYLYEDVVFTLISRNVNYFLDLSFFYCIPEGLENERMNEQLFYEFKKIFKIGWVEKQ